MSINLRQGSHGPLESYPNPGSVGSVRFTFNAGATAAQVAADDSLFNNWTLLAAASTGRSGPVTVYLVTDLTVTGTAALNNFPGGSQMMGAGQLRTVTLSGTVGIRGIELFHSLQIVGDMTGVPPLNDPAIIFRDCEFNHTVAPVVLLDTNGSTLNLQGCVDTGATVLGLTVPVVQITGAGAENYSLIMEDTTVLASNAVLANNVAYNLFYFYDQSAGASALQTQAAGAAIINTFSTAALSAPNIDGSAGNIGANTVWPIGAANESAQLSAQFLIVGTDNSGDYTLDIGQTNAFIQGQILYVRNAGNNGDTITLRNPGGGAILGATVIGTAGGAGTQNCVTLIWHRDGAGVGTPGWEIVSAGTT